MSVPAISAAALTACNKAADKSKPEDKAEAKAVDTSAPKTPVEEAPIAEEATGPVGSIQGQVLLSGDIPEMPILPKGSDPKCDQSEVRAETIMTGEGGGLANAVVRLAPGAIADYKPSAAQLGAPVVIDQDKCMYRPRVQGALRGQTLELRNSDATTHNVHARSLPWGQRQDTETLTNRAHPPGVVMSVELGPEPVTKLKCDVHGWMQGYVVVSDNPYFATTDSDGRFTIEKVPVGSYPVEIWHEFYGVKEGRVEVKEGEAATLSLGFDAQADSPLKGAGQ